MKTKRTLITAVLAGSLILQAGALAADNPAYLNDGTTYYPLAAVAPKGDSIIGMPGERMDFSYSFAGKEVQYSDFLIAPQPYAANIEVEFVGSTESHTFTMQIIDKETNAVVEEWICDVMKDGRTGILPYLAQLKKRQGYYLKAINPSTENAAGTVSVKIIGQSTEMMLESMKIISGYENGQFIPARNITRAEMCKMIAKMLGYEEVPPRQVFADVPASHWASAYIAFCYENGIVGGIGDNRFAPDAEITGADVITMLVRALGRAPQAEAMGGYPNGYMIVASQEEITREVNIISGNPMTRKDAAQCLHNTLFAPIMVKKDTAEVEEYQVMDGVGNVPLDTFYLRFAAKNE